MKMWNLSASAAENENCDLVFWRIHSPLSQLFLAFCTGNTGVRLLTSNFILFCMFETHPSYHISKTLLHSVLPVNISWTLILILSHRLNQYRLYSSHLKLHRNGM